MKAVQQDLIKLRAYEIWGNCPGWFAAWSARLTVAGQGLLGA